MGNVCIDVHIKRCLWYKIAEPVVYRVLRFCIANAIIEKGKALRFYDNMARSGVMCKVGKGDWTRVKHEPERDRQMFRDEP